MDHRRHVVLIRVAKASMVGVAALLGAFGHGATALLVDKRLPAAVAGTHWYVIGQEDDCGSGVREARRRARARGEIPPNAVQVLLGGSRSREIDAEVRQLQGWRRNAVVWTLWLRGARRTPVLLEFRQWYSLGTVEHLSPRPAP